MQIVRQHHERAFRIAAERPLLFKGPEDTARDKAQWKGPRLLACEHSFGTERTDAGGNTDIGVLLATLPKPGMARSSARSMK